MIRPNLDYNNVIHSKNLIRSFKQNKIDLVFAEFGTTGADILGICKQIKIPLIVNFHGFDSSDKSILDLYRYKYIDMFQYASAIIAVSKEMVIDLKTIGCPEEKIHYITYGPADLFLKTNQFLKMIFTFCRKICR